MGTHILALMRHGNGYEFREDTTEVAAARAGGSDARERPRDQENGERGNIKLSSDMTSMTSLRGEGDYMSAECGWLLDERVALLMAERLYRGYGVAASFILARTRATTHRILVPGPSVAAGARSASLHCRLPAGKHDTPLAAGVHERCVGVRRLFPFPRAAPLFLWVPISRCRRKGVAPLSISLMLSSIVALSADCVGGGNERRHLCQ